MKYTWISVRLTGKIFDKCIKDGSGSSPFSFEMERLQFTVRISHGEHQWSKTCHAI